MSHVVTDIVRFRKVGSPTRKAVLMFMAGCASDDGTGIWTSKQNMADDLEMGKRTVQVCIDDMVAAGLISEVGRRSCRNGFTVEYRINLDAVRALESTREDASTRAAPAPVTTHAAPAPVQHVHVTRAAPAPQDVQLLHPNLPRTILEPSSKRKTRMPDDAVLSQKQISIAAELGHSEQEAVAQFDRFKSGALANDRRYANWDAAWRNWFQSDFFKPITKGLSHDSRGEPRIQGYAGNNYRGGQPSSIAGIVSQLVSEGKI